MIDRSDPVAVWGKLTEAEAEIRNLRRTSREREDIADGVASLSSHLFNEAWDMRCERDLAMAFGRELAEENAKLAEDLRAAAKLLAKDIAQDMVDMMAVQLDAEIVGTKGFDS